MQIPASRRGLLQNRARVVIYSTAFANLFAVAVYHFVQTSKFESFKVYGENISEELK